MYLPLGYEIETLGRFSGGEDGTYGTISYRRPLTEKEKKDFDLLECVSTEQAVDKILSDRIAIARLMQYVNDPRTNIYNSSDNPFAHWMEDAMYKERIYSDWRKTLVLLQQRMRGL